MLLNFAKPEEGKTHVQLLKKAGILLSSFLFEFAVTQRYQTFKKDLSPMDLRLQDDLARTINPLAK